MAELNKIQFFLFVALMIFPVRALDVILSGAHENFKQKSEINIDIIDGEKIYHGTGNQLTYRARNGTSRVIVYIISRSRCIEILRPAVSEFRSQIAHELYKMHYDLVFLGIEHIDDDEYHLIGAFILQKIQPHPNRPDIIIETIGENRFDQFYGYYVIDFDKYQENEQICGGTLLARLRTIPHGARKPVESNDKEIKLFGYHPFVKEELQWFVCVENDLYVPNVDLSDPKYNFMIKHPTEKIYLLILSGREYSAVTNYGTRGAQRKAMRKILSRMTKNDEVLIILGAFNFHWSEIDIVTQIILKHSEGLQRSVYNVFTCGYGMFNTYYRNVYEDDGRDIRQQSNSNASEVIQLLMGGEVNGRVINVYYYYDNEWKGSNIPINLINGRYAPEEEFINFTLPCRYQKIAFIVYDRAEMNVPIDLLSVGQCLLELEQSGIGVVFIEALNFGLDDIHIIAEWIDHHHSGVINLEQIAVLGGGIFDTIFQSESTTYNTFLDTGKSVLKIIRNAYAKSSDGKSVFATEIDEYSNLEIWSYPMNTLVNGFYEPDLIRDKNMFETTDKRRNLFVITNVYNFRKTTAINGWKPLSSLLRSSVNAYYPSTKWSIFLVGLNNFEERHYHLFAELVKRQINDRRFLQEVVRVMNYDIGQAFYQYKDSAPFDVETRSEIRERFKSLLFGWTCRLT